MPPPVPAQVAEAADALPHLGGRGIEVGALGHRELAGGVGGWNGKGGEQGEAESSSARRGKWADIGADMAGLRFC